MNEYMIEELEAATAIQQLVPDNLEEITQVKLKYNLVLEEEE